MGRRNRDRRRERSEDAKTNARYTAMVGVVGVVLGGGGVAGVAPILKWWDERPSELDRLKKANEEISKSFEESRKQSEIYLEMLKMQKASNDEMELVLKEIAELIRQKKEVEEMYRAEIAKLVPGFKMVISEHRVCRSDNHCSSNPFASGCLPSVTCSSFPVTELVADPRATELNLLAGAIKGYDVSIESLINTVDASRSCLELDFLSYESVETIGASSELVVE